MHCKIFSATTIGVTAHVVEVEVDLSFGLLDFQIVGLPDVAIKESRRRVTTALKNSGFHLPEKKITVNLAPADLKKEGTAFDLPIALGILQAAQLISIPHSFIEQTLCVGELSLNGAIRPIKGALPIAYDARSLGKKRLILPRENAQEAALIKDIEVIGVDHLTELVAYFRSEKNIEPTSFRTTLDQKTTEPHIDFDEVKGQLHAKRALQIAAAGRHNILFVGPPGAGKTMLAKRLSTIMPPMSFDEIVETSKVYSISGKLDKQSLVVSRPFRNPHHTISQAGLVGGGSFPQPGDISLAHNGILFLDELTEFKRATLEVLRQPLESKNVSIARAQHAIFFPASFLLVAALNPCPCGFLGDKKKRCHCSFVQINRYLEKLSGPLLDRIDLQVAIQSVEYDTLVAKNSVNQSSKELYSAVEKAVAIQKDRFGSDAVYNSTMPQGAIEKHCILTVDAQSLLKKAFERLNLTMRGYYKAIKIARTIADLEGASMIDVPHIQEAIMYRSLDQHLEALKRHDYMSGAAA
jgi:magnesium chelatase family protein